jgi:site-specific DNA recombinase
MEPVVAVYVRVSTDRQAETQTSEQQVAALQAYVAQQGWVLAPEHLYRDEGLSGARLDRPALDRLRDAAARGAVDTVLIASPDRLARRYAYQVWLLEGFERAGCRVVFLERPPSGDPQDALLIQIRGAVAEYERTVIADRMRRGRLAALQAGRLLPWSTPPYGYRLDPRRPRDPAGVRIEPDEATLVGEIFGWYAEEGLTSYQVAQRLTARGVPTAHGHAVWTTSAVRRILSNATYSGLAYGNREREVPARRLQPILGDYTAGAGGTSRRLRPAEEWVGVPVPAVISTELFARVQERLGHNRACAARNTRHGYLLRCLVSCGRCGLAHYIWTNGRYAYYCCRGAATLVSRLRPERCATRKVPTAQLDALVWADVCQVLSDPAILDEALRRARQGWLGTDEQEARRHDLQQRQRDLQRQIERLIDAYSADVLSLEELGARRRKLEDRLAALRREEQQAVAQVLRDEQAQEVAASMERFRTRIVQGLERADFAMQRAIIEMVVDRVVVDAPEVEVRYVMPLTGIAQRKGVLRPHHRARPPAPEGPLSLDAWLQDAPLCATSGRGSTGWASCRVIRG